jgi:hypothetical protein
VIFSILSHENQMPQLYSLFGDTLKFLPKFWDIYQLTGFSELFPNTINGPQRQYDKMVSIYKVSQIIANNRIKHEMDEHNHSEGAGGLAVASTGGFCSTVA